MGVSANPPPQSKIPNKILSDDELRSYFVTMQEDLYRLWLRSGGGTDSVSEITIDLESIIERLDAIENRLDVIEAELIAINAEIVLIKARLDALEARMSNSDQNISGLMSDQGKIRANARDQQRELKNINQVMAGLQ